MPPHDNPSVSTEYFRLVSVGIDENRLTDLEGASRAEKTSMSEELEQLWEEEWEMDLADFPRECISREDLEYLFNKTMSFEQLLVPGFFEEQTLPTIDQLEQDFYDNSDKYCGVDLDTVLGDEFEYNIYEELESMMSGVSEV